MSLRESELKFSFANYSVDRTLNSLNNICQPDGKYHKGMVNSVYFDTHDWLLAMEKASSDYLKTKLRIRWYEYFDEQHASADKNSALQVQSKTSKAFIELKRKIGSKREKKRLALDIEGSSVISSLINADLSNQVQRFIAEHAPELSGHDLQPKFCVSYSRHRFVEPTSNSRIALDSHIRARAIRSAFGMECSDTVLPEWVLEVKGQNDELPHALRILDSSNFRKAAFSKYFLCFQSLTGYAQ